MDGPNDCRVAEGTVVEWVNDGTESVRIHTVVVDDLKKEVDSI
jgi:plastocyanin